MSLKEDFIGQNVEKQSWLPTNFFFLNFKIYIWTIKKMQEKIQKNLSICIFWIYSSEVGEYGRR